jgi:hypothetical protein
VVNEELTGFMKSAARRKEGRKLSDSVIANEELVLVSHPSIYQPTDLPVDIFILKSQHLAFI